MSLSSILPDTEDFLLEPSQSEVDHDPIEEPDKETAAHDVALEGEVRELVQKGLRVIKRPLTWEKDGCQELRRAGALKHHRCMGWGGIQ